MVSLLSKVRTALQDPRLVMLNEDIFTAPVTSVGVEKELQSVDIKIAPAEGIYHLETDQYWTETGKNIQNLDFFWGHWRCTEVDNLNKLLQKVFASAEKGTSREELFIPLEEVINGQKNKGMRFTHHLGELLPLEAGYAREAGRIKEWFRNNTPKEFYWPRIVAKEVVGIGLGTNTFSYQIFPECSADFEELTGVKKSSHEDALHRVIEIECFPCVEFYRETASLLKKRRMATKISYEEARRWNEALDKEIEALGWARSNDMTIKGLNLVCYNDHFNHLRAPKS